jgi:hypothetical protein
MMKVWRAKVVLYLLMIFLVPTWLSGQEGKEGRSEQSKGEAWSYQLQIREKGTRSEGRTGILTKDGAEIIGKEEGEILETPFGKFRWFGKPLPADPMFRDRGWLNQWAGGRKTIEGTGI